MFQIRMSCSPFENWNKKIITANLLNVDVSFIVLCRTYLCFTRFSVFRVSKCYFFCNICFPLVYTVCIYSNKW